MFRPFVRIISWIGGQFPVHCEVHGQAAGQPAYKIGDRLRQKDAVYSQAVYVGQEQRQRHYDHDLAKQGEKHCLLCLPQRNECGLPGKLKGHHHKPEKVQF